MIRQSPQCRVQPPPPCRWQLRRWRPGGGAPSFRGRRCYAPRVFVGRDLREAHRIAMVHRCVEVTRRDVQEIPRPLGACHQRQPRDPRTAHCGVGVVGKARRQGRGAETIGLPQPPLHCHGRARLALGPLLIVGAHALPKPYEKRPRRVVGARVAERPEARRGRDRDIGRHEEPSLLPVQ